MKFSLLLPLVFVCQIVFAQNLPVVEIATLPDEITETSGVEKTGPNRFWSHNDSGGNPEIFAFDSTGTLLKTLSIANAENVDWEDITQGNGGEFYIGDFGNNNNDRSAINGTPLTIYIIPNPDGISGNSVAAQQLVFEYQDRDFNAPAGNHNFDMEAFFFFNDSLHLFSKNRTSPTTGYVKHYILPAQPGNYIAMLVDSFDNGGARVTAADIAPNKQTVALLLYDRVHIITCFAGSKFLSTGHVQTLFIPFTQKEGLVFSDDTHVYMTDERLSSTVGQRLYRSNLTGFTPTPFVITATVGNTCPGDSNGFITPVISGGFAPYSAVWSNTDSTVAITHLAQGSYTMYLTDTHGCTADTAFTVDENAVVIPQITLSNNQLISNNNDIVFWLLNGNPTIANVNDTIDPPMAGCYQVVVHSNNCWVTSDSLCYSIPDAIDEDKIPAQIIITKTENGYYLQNKSTQNTAVKLYAMDGRLVNSFTLNAGSNYSTSTYMQGLHLFVFDGVKYRVN